MRGVPRRSFPHCPVVAIIDTLTLIALDTGLGTEFVEEEVESLFLAPDQCHQPVVEGQGSGLEFVKDGLQYDHVVKVAGIFEEVHA